MTSVCDILQKKDVRLDEVDDYFRTTGYDISGLGQNTEFIWNSRKFLKSYSEDFKQPGESKIALDVYYQLERRKEESPLEFCIRMGWEKYIYEMLAVDFLILNRDRHGANIEVLRDRQKKKIRLAPLFDHGLSLFFSSRNIDEIQKADVMEDKPVQCFVGGHSAKSNLHLIPPGKLPDLCSPDEKTKGNLFEGLENILSKEHRDKIWEMLQKRWEYYEDFCNQR